ncbi:unnamed protein product [Polarella glacialis]|uniref:Uncharacterized protein n=1 Tax=Polarella glacialis TaxID=89957 RepID=A0A813E2I5_POLGL|nr:unnamed protein product [Polarella glacialis]
MAGMTVLRAEAAAKATALEAYAKRKTGFAEVYNELLCSALEAMQAKSAAAARTRERDEVAASAESLRQHNLCLEQAMIASQERERGRETARELARKREQELQRKLEGDREREMKRQLTLQRDLELQKEKDRLWEQEVLRERARQLEQETVVERKRQEELDRQHKLDDQFQAERLVGQELDSELKLEMRKQGLSLSGGVRDAAEKQGPLNGRPTYGAPSTSARNSLAAAGVAQAMRTLSVSVSIPAVKQEETEFFKKGWRYFHEKKEDVGSDASASAGCASGARTSAALAASARQRASEAMLLKMKQGQPVPQDAASIWREALLEGARAGHVEPGRCVAPRFKCICKTCQRPEVTAATESSWFLNLWPTTANAEDDDSD